MHCSIWIEQPVVNRAICSGAFALLKQLIEILGASSYPNAQRCRWSNMCTKGWIGAASWVLLLRNVPFHFRSKSGRRTPTQLRLRTLQARQWSPWLRFSTIDWKRWTNTCSPLRCLGAGGCTSHLWNTVHSLKSRTTEGLSTWFSARQVRLIVVSFPL